MVELPAFAIFLGLAATVLAIGAAIALAAGQRRRYLEEREQRLRLRLAWENTTDLMGVLRVTEDGRFLREDMNAANMAWFARALPQIGEEDWRTRDLEWLLRERAGYTEAEVAATLAPHREVVRTGKPLAVSHDLRTTGERVFRQAVISPMFDRKGRVTRLFYRGTDVTGLRLAEERLRAILERNPGLVAIIGREDGRFRYVNESWSRISGYSAAEAASLTVYDLGIWPTDQARRDALAPAFEHTEARRYERTLKRKDGGLAHVLFSALPVVHDGELCLLAAGIDVTELEQAREEAARMTAHFERVFRLMPEPVSISSLEDGRMLEVNDAWLQFYGLEATRVIGRTVEELGMWVDPAGRREIVERVKNGERVTGFAGRFRTAHGIAHGFLSAERISWKGQPVIIVATRDVTALERARRMALEESRHFTSTFQVSPLPLSINVGPEGRVAEVNAAWQRFFGLSREEAVGRTGPELGLWADPADRERLFARLDRGETVSGAPSRLLRRGGEVADVLVSIERIEWYGSPARLVVVQDVTELRRSAEEIRRLNESLESRVRERTADLERAVKEMEAFSYSVSHDLRAPLRHIAGFTRMLIEEGQLPPDSEAARYAERAAQAATRLGTLIDELLDYSRLGRKSLQLQDTDLSRLVAQIRDDLSSGLAGRKVRWEVAALPTVRADPTLMRLVLQNLIENAVKYTGTRAEARIEIGGRREGAEDLVWVRDNGVGFDMKYSGKLFGVFERMHTEAEFEGTGIGLANAKRIVERHGGRIWFESAPECGATFTFALPAAAPIRNAA